MIIIDKVLLYGRTVRQLKFIQIRGQIKRKLKRNHRPMNYGAIPKVNDVKISISELDADERYIKRFNLKALENREVELLCERHRLDGCWRVDNASRLWNFNLHYLEFTAALAVEWKRTGEAKYKDKWIEIISSWLEDGSQTADAYEPYTISLRMVNVLIGLELIGEIDKWLKKRIYESLYHQYKYLSENLELALLANHYFENLKALVIGSVVFGEKNDYHKYWTLFLQQTDQQILADGMHYERSPMYHKIILEDVLRVYMVLKISHPLDAEKLEPVIGLMAEALKGLENGFRTTPLFNDSGENMSKTTDGLIKAASRMLNTTPDAIQKKNNFQEAGYYRLDQGKTAVIFDCGDIGPGYMGGHGHNDCLSFELSVDGRKIFTNSGTGQYQGGLREFFRSTAAHNTVMIDNREQNELWGEHRVGRRGSCYKVHRKTDCLTGIFKSYAKDRYRRQMQWKDGKLLITDSVKSRGTHTARQFFHLTPGLKFERAVGFVKVLDGDKAIAVITPSVGSDYVIHTEGMITNYSSEFGKYEKKQVLEIRTPFCNEDKIHVEIKIEGE